MSFGGRVQVPRLWADAGPVGTAMRTCRTHLVFAALFSCLINLLYLSPTLYMMQVYDRVIPTSGRLTLVFVTLLLFVALACLSLLEHARTRLMIRAGVRLERRLAAVTLDRMTSGESGTRSATNLGAMRDLDTLRQVTGGTGITALLDAPWTPVYLAVSFLLHPLLGLLTLAGGVILAGLAFSNERATRRCLHAAAQHQAANYARQESLVRQGETIRALGMRREMLETQVSGREHAVSLAASGMMLGATYSAVIKFIRLALQSLALGAGAWLAISGQLSAGSVIAASVLLSRALQPVEQIVGNWGGLIQARGALANLEALLGVDGRHDEPRTRLPSPRAEVLVSDIRHALQINGHDILKGVSFAIRPGEVIGLIGPSGAGKSTLARIVAGAIHPQHGVVRIDGASYRDWDQDDLPRHIGYLPQDPGLFEGRIRDNIARVEVGIDNDTSDAAVMAATKAAGVHEMILATPQGYDTRLGPGGGGLSSGQAQRIALARALYRAPALLVLDEPNAPLDGEGEAALARALIGARERGAAVLLVAHRAAALASVQRLIFLKEGAIAMDGAKDDVLAALKRAGASRRPGPALVASNQT